jgi:hypothetical protein
MVNARSTGRKSGPSPGRRCTSAAARPSAARSASSPSPVFRRDRHHLGLFQHAAREKRGQVGIEERPPVVPQTAKEVRLGQSHDPGPDPEELADVEVLAGLGHDALVRGDDEDGQVDPAGAGGHRLHEALVARDVDHSGHRSVRQGEVGEPELERDAPPLLLRKAVGVDPGERLDQRRLAVVDVAGGADDHARDRARGDAGSGSGARSKRPSSVTGP